jgi:RNA 2',3'-cyclic 3'-phosphodiesterase
VVHLSNADSKRVFISIEFQENIKNYLKEIQSQVLKESKKGNFTIIENFHLTLKFIGETKIDKLEEIKKSIENVASYQTRFNLYLDKLGEFKKGNTSVVWVGVKSSEALDKLYIDLNKSLEEVNIKSELKKFTPHITIGRQVVLKEDFSKISKKITLDTMSILVDKISLMESTRIDGQLKYIPIYIKNLK